MNYKQILKQIIPESIFQMVEDNSISRYANKHKSEILSYLKSDGSSLKDAKEMIEFIEKNGVHVFPYEFTKKHDYRQIQVLHDSERNLNYVLYQDKRLYYKRGFEKRQIQRRFNMSLIEQDIRSAHCYSSPDFAIEKGETLVDIGVAEGNFTFLNIDSLGKAYLFEADSSWIEALEATFAPWNDKVTIINKFVSKSNEANHVNLDTFFKDVEIDFIKIDVDGEEANLLDGCDGILSREGHLKMAVCTYHNQNDADDFEKLLIDKSFKTSFSDGFMLFYFDPKFKSPYFRKGVIRAQK